MNPYAFCENSKRKPFCQKLRASRTVLFALLCGVALDYLATLPAARGKGLGGTFLCLLQRRLAPAMLMGEVEVPDGGSHDGLRLRRMHFYARHGFELEPVKSRVYGVTYRVISYARPALMKADDVCEALRAIYEELLASRLRVRMHVRIWQEEPEF